MSCYMTYGPISLEDVVLRGIVMKEHLTEDGYTVRYREYAISFAAHVNGGKNVHGINPLGTVTRGGSFDPGVIAMALTQKLSQPRQYFKLEFGQRTFLEVPVRSWHVSDSAGGPFPNNISVTSIAGDLGIANAGGYFLVTGTINVAVDGRSTSDGGELTYLQGFSIGWEYDIDGDTNLHSKVTTVKVHGRPEAIRSLAVNPNRQSVIGLGMTQLQTVLYVEDGYKRKRVRLEVKPGGTEAMILVVDAEHVLATGSLSPSLTFEPIHSDTYRWSGEKKEGAPQSMQTIVIRAQYKRMTHRAEIIKQMLYWVCIKGPGGMNGAGKKLRFVAYVEATLQTLYAASQMELTVRMLTNPVVNGAGGVPLSPSWLRLNSSDDLQDVNDALAPYRVIGEAQPAFPYVALSPSLDNDGFDGRVRYLRDALQLDQPNPGTRITPDGRDYYCPTPAAGGIQPPTPVQDNSGVSGFTYEEFAVDTFSISESPLGWQSKDNTYYESVWMATKYKTKKGKMRLPTAGVIPAGSTLPDGFKLRIETQVHAPISEKVVSWGIQAISPTCPSYPDPNHTAGDASKFTFKDEEIQPSAPVAIGPNLFAWTIVGKYRYDCEDEKKAGESLSAGLLPTSPGPASNYNVPGGASSPGYIIG